MRRISITLGGAAVLSLVAYAVQAQPPDQGPRKAQTRQGQKDRAGNLQSDRDSAGERLADKAITKRGVVAELQKNDDGDVGGLVLEDGTDVRFPPNEQLSGAIAPKDPVTISGWTHAGESELHAATIKNEASGKLVNVDRPPPTARSDRASRPAADDEAPAEDGVRPQRKAEGGRVPRAKPEPRQARVPQPSPQGQYSLEQAVSDRAQLHTIAFDGLAFLTGDFASDTFLPPGKVSDYFGFQYMRDIDAVEGGHNTSFLTKIANNMLAILNEDQRTQLLTLAEAQQDDIRRFAELRLPLIKAFRRNLEGDLPAGCKGLDKYAVIKYSADLYTLDGVLAYQRAQVLGGIISSFNAQQKAALAKLKFGNSRTWPDIPDPLDKQRMSHAVDVAVMTYASEMFAWYAGSVEADTYFCPERHGMYFGGFGMKTAPAMGKEDYSISTALTGDSGEAFLATLAPPQRTWIVGLVELQRRSLLEIVKTRRAIASELRRFQKGAVADKTKVLAWSKRYGELDGELSYLYATAFGMVGKTLTPQQKQQLARLRTSDPDDVQGPFLYSDPIDLPPIENTDFLFGVRRVDGRASPATPRRK